MRERHGAILRVSSFRSGQMAHYRLARHHAAGSQRVHLLGRGRQTSGIVPRRLNLGKRLAGPLGNALGAERGDAAEVGAEADGQRSGREPLADRAVVEGDAAGGDRRQVGHHRAQIAQVAGAEQVGGEELDDRRPGPPRRQHLGRGEGAGDRLEAGIATALQQSGRGGEADHEARTGSGRRLDLVGPGHGAEPDREAVGGERRDRLLDAGGRAGQLDALSSIVLAPLVIPGLFIGLALFSYFNKIGFELSLVTVIIGQSLVTLPLVVVVVNSRLANIETNMLEAARDLGANGFQAFFKVLLPLIAPTLLGASLLVAAWALDEVIITLWTNGGDTTLPVMIFAKVRQGTDPSVNAIASLVLAGTTITTILAAKFVSARDLTGS